MAAAFALYSHYYNARLIALLGVFGAATFAAAIVPAVVIGFNWKRATALAANVAIAVSLLLNLGIELMDEAEAMCDRLAIMDQGKLLAVDSPKNLISQIEATYAVKLVMAKPMDEAQVAALGGSVELVQTVEDNTYLLRLKNDAHALQAVLDEISKAGLGLEHLEITPVTLEDVFLELTGAELRD